MIYLEKAKQFKVKHTTYALNNYNTRSIKYIAKRTFSILCYCISIHSKVLYIHLLIMYWLCLQKVFFRLPGLSQSGFNI